MTASQKENNGFFIEKSAPARRKYSMKHVKYFMLFALSAIYGFAVLFIFYILVYGEIAVSMFTIYFIGLFGGMAVVLFNKLYGNIDRSRQVMAEVLEEGAEARLIIGPDGEPLHANARFAKLTGKPEAASLADFCNLFDPPEKAAHVLAEVQQKAAPAGMATAELRTLQRGRPAWFQVTCQYIVSRPGYIHWRFDDITHRHQMENDIREEREKLRDFTDNAPVGFFTVDETGRFRFANDTLLRLFGTDSKTLTGKMRLHDFLVDPPKNGRPYDCFEDGGNHQHGELLMKGAGDRVFKAALTHSITRDEDGRLLSRSIVYDMTTEQKMRQALRESEDRFERLFDEAPVGICLLTLQGVISDANQTLSAMMRLPVNALNGKPLLHFVDGDSRTKAEEWLKDLSAGNRADASIEVTLRGSIEVVAQLYARKFKSGDNFVLHFIDITEQRNLEKQFSQSQKMQAIGQLAGGIAHDFNNLLTAMIGFCDLLLMRHKPGDPSFADIMQVKQNANRAANLVRQLLAFSRQQTLQPRVLDMTDVLSDISHLLRRLIGANIELDFVHSADLGLIKADQGQMDQVLVNLVVNARDAMPDGGKITIKTQNLQNRQGLRLSNDDILPAGEWVVISVEDSGTGIAADALPRIFEPFFSTKDVGAGTGLGLATVHGIVHQTGGFISVKSARGEGTTFNIYLPRHNEDTADSKPAAAEEKPAASDLTGSSRIMLVEDEDAVRTFSARALSNKGYHVVDAPGGISALRLMEEDGFVPEILITDVMMPEMDGTTLAKHVREKFPQVKIIFISGYAEDKFKEHLGADVYFLPKPFTLKQLATKVKEVLGGGAE